LARLSFTGGGDAIRGTRRHLAVGGGANGSRHSFGFRLRLLQGRGPARAAAPAMAGSSRGNARRMLVATAALRSVGAAAGRHRRVRVGWGMVAVLQQQGLVHIGTRGEVARDGRPERRVWRCVPALKRPHVETIRHSREGSPLTPVAPCRAPFPNSISCSLHRGHSRAALLGGRASVKTYVGRPQRTRGIGDPPHISVVLSAGVEGLSRASYVILDPSTEAWGYPPSTMTDGCQLSSRGARR